MFYNTYRTTKSTMHSVDKAYLSGVGRNIMNQRERLLNLQKRQKLKVIYMTNILKVLAV